MYVCISIDLGNSVLFNQIYVSWASCNAMASGTHGYNLLKNVILGVV
jgi:hypothetical protein